MPAADHHRVVALRHRVPPRASLARVRRCGRDFWSARRPETPARRRSPMLAGALGPDQRPLDLRSRSGCRAPGPTGYASAGRGTLGRPKEHRVSVGTAFHPAPAGAQRRSRPGASGAGYYAAAVYADFHDIEYNAIREAAAVIDASPLYKYVVGGPDATAAARPRAHARRVEDAGRPGVLHAVVRRGRQDPRRRHRHATDRDEYRITAADPCYRWFLLNATGLDVEVDGHHRLARRPRAAGQAEPRGARGRDAAGLVATCPTSGTGGRRSAASRSTSPAPATPATAATSSGSPPTARSTCGIACSRRAPRLRDLRRRASARWTSRASRPA